MEKSEIGTTNSSHETPFFSFRPRRRSHLQSETYRMLVHILSHCYDHSQVSLNTPITLERLGNDKNGMEQVTKKKKDKHGKSMGPVTTGNESSLHQPTLIGKDSGATSFGGRRFCETRAVISEIDHVMQTEEIEDILKQNDLMTDDDFDANHSQDGGFGRQQMIMDELELIMKGNENHVPDDNINLSVTSLDENQSVNFVAAAVNDQEQQHDLQRIATEEPQSAAKLQEDKEECMQQISRASDMSLDKPLYSEVSKLSENIDDKISFSKTSSFERNQEMQKKEMEWEKQASCSGVSPISNCIIKDVDIEEGEISGDFWNDDESFNMSLGDVVHSEGKVGEKQVLDHVIDKRDSQHIFFTADTNRGREVQLEEHVTNRTLSNTGLVVHRTSTAAVGAGTGKCMYTAGENKQEGIGTEGISYQLAYPDNLVPPREMAEKYAEEYQGISSERKLDAVVCNKKKRAPPSEARKEKKKEKKRKQRAKKNRELGVKRLKLHPVVKPKTITYCQHYLKGRCYEGEKCKFSHDTIPLTKSKPCCHFARHSCMKGADCPFDHQLSNYPCANFFAKGFCNRGGDCMFSHKIPPKEAIPSVSASDALKPEKNPPSFIGTSNLKKQLSTSETSHQNVDASSYSVGILYSNHSKHIIENVLQTNGSGSPSAGKLLVQSHKSHQNDSSPKINGSTESWNLNSQGISDKVGNISGIQMKVPAVAPKGLNFLSFGKNSLEDSNNGKLTSLTLKRRNGFKASPFKISSLQDRPTSSSSRNNIIQPGNHSLGASGTNEMLKKSQSVAAPRGMGFLSFGQDLIDASIDNKTSGSPSSFGFVTSKLVQGNQNGSQKHQNEIQKLQKLPALPVTQGQVLDQLPHGLCKNTSNTSQKALIPALKFAAKLESELEINKSTGCSVVVSHKETRDGSILGGSSNYSSRLLEFLYSLNSKRKQ